jgi:hypothetical protein
MMNINGVNIWHFLGKSGERDLEDKVKSGQPCLLITGNEKSFLIDLDWPALQDTKHHDDPEALNDFHEWAKMMILCVDRKLTQELISGAQDFIRNSRSWLEPHQRNYALFFIGRDGDDAVFVPVPAA